MKYFSMFSGIGGFELGIKKAYDISNKQFTEIKQNRQRRDRDFNEGGYNVLPTSRTAPLCIGYSEIDRYAIQIYEKHFKHKNYGDCTTINPEQLPDFDLIVGGFPCQSFSIAGKRGGFEDTRGTLFFHIARIAKVKRPRYLFLENVKGLLSHDKGNTFATIISTLDELGYDCQWQVLNSKNFGVPQNRERVFIIGHLRGTSRPQVFPFTEQSNTNTTIGESTETSVARTLTGGGHTGGNHSGMTILQLNNPKHSNDRLYSEQGLAPTLNTAQGGNRQPKILPAQWRRTEKGKQFRKEAMKNGKDLTPFNKGHREIVPKNSDIIGTITAQATAKDSLIFDEMRIRRLTPIECERLQGYPDGWTELGTQGKISDSQRYKTLGNSVTTNVIKAIAERLLKTPYSGVKAKLVME